MGNVSPEERLARIEAKLDFLIDHMNDTKKINTEFLSFKHRMIGGWVASTVIASCASLAIKFFVR